MVIRKRKAAAPNSLREKAYLELKQAILEGVLPVEEALTETRLAHDLGASRTPVREALRQLEIEGLVSPAHGRGIVIPSVTAEMASEILEYREAIAGFACRLATERMQEETLQELARLCLQDPTPEKPETLQKIANFFHESIHDACGNRTVQLGLDRINDQLRRIRLVARTIPGRLALSYAERRPVVRAMAARDPDAAEATMRAHIRSTRATTVDALLRHGRMR